MQNRVENEAGQDLTDTDNAGGKPQPVRKHPQRRTM